MAPRTDLRLELFCDGGPDTITAGDYLSLAGPDREVAKVSASWCTLSLVVDGTEIWGARLSLGAIGPVVAQMAPAAGRLESGRRALIRAAVFDVPLAVFLIFEPPPPPASGLYLARVAATDALSDPAWMPDGPRDAALYDYVDSHHGDLTSTDYDGIEACRVDAAALSQCLRREAALGEELVSLLGPGC